MARTWGPLIFVTLCIFASIAAEENVPAEPAIPPVVLEDGNRTTELVVFNATNSNQTHGDEMHKAINEALADDEERVLAGGEVKIRKKRTFCKRCYPTYSYGYGGGGGCCGSCGQCGGGYGGGYVRPIRIKVIPYYGGGGGGCGSCYRPCNVCGRK